MAANRSSLPGFPRESRCSSSRKCSSPRPVAKAEGKQLACFVEVKGHQVELFALQTSCKACVSTGGKCSGELRLAQDEECRESCLESKLIADGVNLVPNFRGTTMSFVDDQEPAPAVGCFILKGRLQR